MARFNREDARTVLPQLEKQIKEISGELKSADEFYSRVTEINLGIWFGSAVLTSSAGELFFSIPTGRVFPEGTRIERISFGVVGRASNSNGGGYYIIKGISGGYTPALLDSDVDFIFYNANNNLKFLSQMTLSATLEGGTNIQIALSGSDNFFSGTTTITGYINNNATTVALNDIVVTLKIPK